MRGLLPLHRHFEFSGRSSRAEFWLVLGASFAALIATIVLDLALGNYRIPYLTVVLGLLLTLPWYAVSARRFHDRNLSGKWLLIPMGAAVLSPVCAFLAGANAYTSTGTFFLLIERFADKIAYLGGMATLIALGTLPGDDAANDYGPPVSGVGSTALPKSPADQDQSAPAPLATRPPPPPPDARAAVDPFDQIERLAKLRDAGVLTDEEFKQQKASILSRIG